MATRNKSNEPRASSCSVTSACGQSTKMRVSAALPFVESCTANTTCTPRSTEHAGCVIPYVGVGIGDDNDAAALIRDIGL